MYHVLLQPACPLSRRIGEAAGVALQPQSVKPASVIELQVSCVCVCVCMCTRTCMCVCLYACVLTCLHVCVSICVVITSMCVLLCSSTYVRELCTTQCGILLYPLSSYVPFMSNQPAEGDKVYALSGMNWGAFKDAEENRNRLACGRVDT